MDFRKYLIIVVIFLILTALVCCFPVVTSVDISIIKAIQSMMSSVSDTIPKAVAGLTYGGKYWLLILVAVLFLILKRKYISSVLLIFTVQFSVYFNDFLKILISRHRPPLDLQITPLTNFSYPSGHSILNMCFFGICIYLIHRYIENRTVKYAAISLCAFCILFVGFTRLWLGVHHPTDVLGGYILGYLFVLIFADIEKKLQK